MARVITKVTESEQYTPLVWLYWKFSALRSKIRVYTLAELLTNGAEPKLALI